MPSNIAQQSIAAFETALAGLSAPLSSDLPDSDSLTHERHVMRDRHADIECAIGMEHCLNGQWEKAWAVMASQAQKDGLTRAAWEARMWENLLSDPMLQTRPM